MSGPMREGRDLHEAASAWVMAEEAGTVDNERLAARDAWLAEHPAHVAAYDAVQRAMRRVDDIAVDPRILALRASALTVNRRRATGAWRLAASLVAGLALFAGGAGVVLGDRSPAAATAVLERIIHPGSDVFHTAIGERSTVTLPDGSVTTLNTDSVLRVVFNDKARGVQLVRGQAMFEVAHGKARPFEVYAGDRVVTALGTVFDVRLDAGEVTVALLQGKVRVGSKAASGAKVVMAPGELLEAKPAEPMRVRNEDLAFETSWRSGVLVFDETPLAEAVEELNRYSTRSLKLDDPSLAAFHVSGRFRTGDIDRFAETLAEIAPVAPRTKTDGSILLTRRE